MLTPAAAVTPIPAALDQMPSERLAALSWCVVPYGGFLERIPVTTLPLAELPAAMRRAEEPGAPLVVMT